LLLPTEPGREPASGSWSAMLALGFRPFYLLAGAYAALGVPVWALQFLDLLPIADPLWHAHEMLFGYAFAVIAGFLLTAVRAWTGRPPPAGAALAAIAALWLCARVLALFSLPAAAAADAAFALSLAWGIGRPLVASRNRNWFFIALIVALGAASIAFLALPRIALAAGLDLVLLVMAIIGGRVIPGFTNNAVPGAGARRIAALETSCIASVLLLLGLDLLDSGFGAAVALGAAGLHAARLALWAPLRTRANPILWILHLSYAWIVVHLALRGCAGFGLAPEALAVHALTVGAIGGLTMGMMTRTARGHTGRPLRAGSAEIAAYWMVQLAAAVRVFLPLILPPAYAAAVMLSAVLWSAAFAVFVIAYIPILARPRLDGQPG